MQNTCIKCGKVLPEGYEKKKCEYCLSKNAHLVKQGMDLALNGGIAALTLVGTVAAKKIVGK